MLFSITIAMVVFLLFLPVCLLQEQGERYASLFQRIEKEQQQRLEQLSGRAHLRLLAYFQHNPQLTNRFAHIVGLDRLALTRSLSRLRWQIPLEEILLAKLIGGVLLLLALLYTASLMTATDGDGVSLFTLLPVIAALVVYLLPTRLIESADQRAQAEIRADIPLFFSIVQSLVEAGMPVHTAIRATATRSSGRLGREFALLEIEEKQYGNWRKALEAMSFRWDVDALIAIVSEINEALTKGISIAPLLAAQVEEQLRLQEDEMTDYSNKLSVRLLPVLIVFLGIPLLFLVMGPSFIGMRGQL